MDLDRPGDFSAVDTRDALGDVERPWEQWEHARRLADVRLELDGITAVVVAGMGGSGISGDVVASVAAEEGGLPILVCKGYTVPAFVGPRTVVATVSHSGNTEETLAAYDDAGQRGARRFAVTAGGALAERCRADGTPLVTVPGGGQPRHALGYLAVPLLVALGLDDSLDEALEIQQLTAEPLGRGVGTGDNAAKQLAQIVAGGDVTLAVGGSAAARVAAYRLKCQLHENAKLPALYAEVPEMDHNEVVGWSEANPLTAVTGLVALRDRAGEHPRIDRRFAVTAEVLGSSLAWQAEIASSGVSPLARLASLLVSVDLVSVYAALALDRDPTPIPAIDRLKERMDT